MAKSRPRSKSAKSRRSKPQQFSRDTRFDVGEHDRIRLNHAPAEDQAIVCKVKILGADNDPRHVDPQSG